MTRRAWTRAEVALLRKRYPDTPTTQLACEFGRSSTAVYQTAYKLGLHKSAAYLAGPFACRLRHGDNVGASCRFPKGNVPWNQGAKGWTAGGRSALTRFKPGHFPANRDPGYYVLGALRVNADGFLEMRTSFRPGARGWRGLHRILWEDAHGPVPNGHCVCFKNGDALDVELGNLELVSRAELMRRNTLHRLPKPLRNTIQALGQLKRRIRERADRRPEATPVRHTRGAARPSQTDGHRTR